MSLNLFRLSIRRFSSGRLYNNILETIGNTPIVKINKLSPSNVNLYVKCEYFNPLSSIKDRMAMGIIEDAENRGLLKPNQTVIEATSGNAGIGLALVCAVKGYPFVAVMADFYSIERRKIMRALGAKVVLTPSKYAGWGMTAKAKELAQENNWFLASQFENPANEEYHANTTAPEIIQTFRGNSKNLDYFVTGYGSGGTFTGTAKVLKAAKPTTKVILVEPTEAALISSGIKQERVDDDTSPFKGAPAKIHDAWNAHVIAGWAPSFIPQLAQKGIDLDLVDEVVTIDPKIAMQSAMDLAQNEGIFTGISGGATFASALNVCEGIKDEDKNVLAMLPDTMERYLSTELFDGIQNDMNDEEMKIAQMTPNYLFDHEDQIKTN